MQKDYRKSFANAETAIGLDANAWDAHYILGLALGIELDHKRAVRELKAVYQLKPTLKHGTALLLQFALANSIWIGILWLLLLVIALLTGNIVLVILVSMGYFAIGLMGFVERKIIHALFFLGIRNFRSMAILFFVVIQIERLLLIY